MATAERRVKAAEDRAKAAEKRAKAAEECVEDATMEARRKVHEAREVVRHNLHEHRRLACSVSQWMRKLRVPMLQRRKWLLLAAAPLQLSAGRSGRGDFFGRRFRDRCVA